jgi:hypothetical protein
MCVSVMYQVTAAWLVVQQLSGIVYTCIGNILSNCCPVVGSLTTVVYVCIANVPSNCCPVVGSVAKWYHVHVYR